MDLRRFEDRKADHLRLSLDSANDAMHYGLDHIRLEHDAIPEINLADVSINTNFWKYTAASPCFISSMTAGHQGGEALNMRLAKVAGKRRWPMGLGSQRRELSDPQAAMEWKKLRQAAPSAFLFSNLGLAELIKTPLEQVLRLTESLEAGALIIHLNPLQESIQPEGTTNFAGGLKALEALVKRSQVPVIAKETGCGIGEKSAKKLLSAGVSVIDVSGYGGTHWGRIEGARASEQNANKQAKAAVTFKSWGIPTVDSILALAKVVSESQTKTEIWASGGIRTGLDAAKCLSLGATKVGYAKGALSAALAGEAELEAWMDQIEFELRLSLFNTGCLKPADLRSVTWQKI